MDAQLRNDHAKTMLSSQNGALQQHTHAQRANGSARKRINYQRSEGLGGAGSGRPCAAHISAMENEDQGAPRCARRQAIADSSCIRMI